MKKYLQHDVQQESDGFEKIAIQKVGVRKIKAPIEIKRKGGDTFNTIAHISAYCNLDKDMKGINMSRNSRVLFKELTDQVIHFDKLHDLTKKLADAHQTSNINLKLWFEYLYKYDSPVTKISGYEPCVVVADTFYQDGVCKTYLQVITNESSCCPCSKGMSSLKNNITDEQLDKIGEIDDFILVDKILSAGFGAHNQRSEIDIKVELNKLQGDDIMWIEDLIEIAKKSASAETYNVLKRPDEKYVTECQYLGGYYTDVYEQEEFIKVEGSGPKFCEDIARDAAAQLEKELDKRILDYCVIVNNEESIHTSLMATAVLHANRTLK